MPSRVEEPLEANLDNMESVNGNSTTIGVEKKENEMVGKKEEKKDVIAVDGSEEKSEMKEKGGEVEKESEGEKEVKEEGEKGDTEKKEEEKVVKEVNEGVVEEIEEEEKEAKEKDNEEKNNESEENPKAEEIVDVKEEKSNDDEKEVNESNENETKEEEATKTSEEAGNEKQEETKMKKTIMNTTANEENHHETNDQQRREPHSFPRTQQPQHRRNHKPRTLQHDTSLFPSSASHQPSHPLQRHLLEHTQSIPPGGGGRRQVRPASQNQILRGFPPRHDASQPKRASRHRHVRFHRHFPNDVFPLLASDS